MLLNYVGAAAMVGFNLLHIKEKQQFLGGRSKAQILRFSKADQRRLWARLLSNTAFWAVTEILLISVLQYIPAPIMNRRFGDLVGTGANYYGLLLTSPLLLVTGCMFLRVDPVRQMDLLTPAFPLALSISKIGCFCAGCCGGIECAFLGGKAFPVQLLESAVAILLFAVLMFFRKEVKPGTMFPLYVILYSGTRFFSEFLRVEENVLWVFKVYHFQCVGGVLLGIAALNFMLEYENYKQTAGKAQKIRRKKEDPS